MPRVELAPPPEPTAPDPPGPTEDAPPEERLRTSQRVILHVMAQGRLAPGEVAPFGLSQAGLCEALDLTQSSLAKTLGRLVAAGVLTVGRRHVEHQDRRLKVYELTPLGESLARDLRRRTVRASLAPPTQRPSRPLEFGR
ncbi:MAG: winged helix DNA-binding protein [Candidatus Lutacidiplasmatales archaeon]